MNELVYQLIVKFKTEQVICQFVALDAGSAKVKFVKICKFAVISILTIIFVRNYPKQCLYFPNINTSTPYYLIGLCLLFQIRTISYRIY